MKMIKATCRRCNGTGKYSLNKSTCFNCHGFGYMMATAAQVKQTQRTNTKAAKVRRGQPMKVFD